jgi:hypothetical protein
MSALVRGANIAARSLRSSGNALIVPHDNRVAQIINFLIRYE